MHGKEAIKNTYELSQMVLMAYINDLSDEQLMSRPGEGCNHIAWQLGHVIRSEAGMLESISPENAVELPEGFAEKHDKENSGSDDPADFASKEEYVALFAKLKDAVYNALESHSDEELAAAPPEYLQQICKDVGGVYGLIATHPMMHVGQFVPVRRMLGKPVVM